jgi:FKBP-type peptidyl-prolyl cis-trans isomerase (trigger factor)
MNENIYYNLEEREIDNKIDHDILYKNYIENNNVELDQDIILALRMDYSSNYNLSDIKKILDYYVTFKKLDAHCVRKKRKEELIDQLVLFETDNNNIEIVSKRKRLWFYIKEIKNDKYLSKYIIFN